MSREVAGLRIARIVPRPKCIPSGRPRKGVKLDGLRYEAAVGRAIPGAKTGIWIEYNDANGWGYCNPDLVLSLGPGEPVCVIEVKRTDVEASLAQINSLYRPCLALCLGRPVVGLRVARFLTGGSDAAIDSFAAAIAAWRADSLAVPLLHWPGRYAPALVPPKGPHGLMAAWKALRAA